MPYFLTLSHRLVLNSGRLFCWSFPLHFPLHTDEVELSSGCFSARFMVRDTAGLACLSSFRFLLLRLWTQGCGYWLAATAFLHVRSPCAAVFSLGLSSPRVCLSFMRTRAWHGRLLGHSQPQESMCFGIGVWGTRVFLLGNWACFTESVFNFSCTTLLNLLRHCLFYSSNILYFAVGAVSGEKNEAFQMEQLKKTPPIGPRHHLLLNGLTRRDARRVLA